MAERDDFRSLCTLNLPSLFISLGLSREKFRTDGSPLETRLFDAALNTDPGRPDSLWIFNGSDYRSFNLRSGSFEGDWKAIAGNWGGQSWPLMFSPGIDAAAWGGPAFPNLWYFFREDHYIRLDSNQGGGNWLVDTGPTPIVNHWGSAKDTWFTNGCDAALHGIGAKHHAKIHLFKDDQYMRHNLLDGSRDIGPAPIKEYWHLPEPFSKKIDLAFYGAGAQEEKIYFFSGLQCALYDTEIGQTVKVQPIETYFPAFAEFLPRPQLFLVEDYCLETYVGAPGLGRLIETQNVPPGSEKKTIMVTETTEEDITKHKSSLFDSQDEGVVNDLKKQVNNNTEKLEGSENYRYHLNAHAHGEAEATSAWGGEADMTLDVAGGSDSLRSNFAESAFEAVNSQVTASSKRVTQRTYESSVDIMHMERVLRREEIVLKNPSDSLRVFEFYQQTQSFITLLVLKRVQIAYADGTDRPKLIKLAQISAFLTDKLATEEQCKEITSYISQELSAVADEDGKIVPLLQDNAQGTIALRPNPKVTFAVQHANGDVQTIVSDGLVIKAAKKWVAPTMTMIAKEVT